MLRMQDKQCFLADLLQQQPIMIVYEIFGQEAIEETPNSLGFTFRRVGSDEFLADSRNSPEMVSRNYSYIAQESGRYEYCFVRNQGKAPTVKLTFYAVMIPISKDEHEEANSTPTQDTRILIEDLHQLLYSTLVMKEEQKTLSIREARHKKSR
jgi:hypothetical protein